MIASWMLYAALVGSTHDRRGNRARSRRRGATAANANDLGRRAGALDCVARRSWNRAHDARAVSPVRLIPFAITVQSPAMTSHASALSRARDRSCPRSSRGVD